MGRLLETLLEPKLPELLEKEVLTQTHVHTEFENVPESGIGEVRPCFFRDAIDRVEWEMFAEDVT